MPAVYYFFFAFVFQFVVVDWVGAREVEDGAAADVIEDAGVVLVNVNVIGEAAIAVVEAIAAVLEAADVVVVVIAAIDESVIAAVSDFARP